MQLEEAKKQKADFDAMLRECKEITGATRFRSVQKQCFVWCVTKRCLRDIEELLGSDPRFTAVPVERSRMDWAYDYIDELADKEEAARKEKREKGLAGGSLLALACRLRVLIRFAGDNRIPCHAGRQHPLSHQPHHDVARCC